MISCIYRINLRGFLKQSQIIKTSKLGKLVNYNRVCSKHYNNTLNSGIKRSGLLKSNPHNNNNNNINRLNHISTNPNHRPNSTRNFMSKQGKQQIQGLLLGKTKSNTNANANTNNLFQNAILQNRFFVAPTIDGISFGNGNDTNENDLDGELSGNSADKNSASSRRNARTNKIASHTESAQVLFDLIFLELQDRFGLENLRFPKDIMWLAGAPGSGKGEMTQFISDQIGNTNPPIMMSEILQGAEIESLKNSGDLVNDRIVLRILFERLLQSQYQTGVIVDGFPRTAVQAECIKFLFDKMLWLRRHHEKTEYFEKFRRPVFHVTVLYVEERVSVQRQLERGQKLTEHNRLVEQTGVGTLQDVRHTDLNGKLARDRYKNFYNNMYASLQIIKEKFPFHFINAEKSRKEVRASIIDELQYQSGNELADTTFDNVRRIPLASEIKVDARHDLVRRLDTYQRDNPQLFNKVIATVNEEFCTIVKRQALSGQVIIRTENETFFEALAIDMALDLLSERGYRVILDYLRDDIPNKVDLKTGDVIGYKRKRILVFNISFPPPKIRHATQKSTQWETTLR